MSNKIQTLEKKKKNCNMEVMKRGKEINKRQLVPMKRFQKDFRSIKKSIQINETFQPHGSLYQSYERTRKHTAKM